MGKHAAVVVAAGIVVALSGWGAILAAAQSGRDEGSVPYETVATLDAVTTENIFQAEDGMIFVTGHQSLKVFRITPDRRVDTFVTLPSSMAHVLGVAGTRDGFALTASERTFVHLDATGRPQINFADTGPAVVLVDKKGTITSTLHGIKGSFFNGISAAVQGGRELILTADSNAGTIWRVDTATKQIEAWLKDPALAPPKGATIGANGIKIHNGWVYVNSGGTMYRVRIGADGRPQGMLMAHAKDIGGEDFGLTKDGTLYIPHMGELKKISPNGEVSTAYEKVPHGPALIVSRDDKWLYWPSRGEAAPVPGRAAPPGAIGPRLLRAPVR